VVQRVHVDRLGAERPSTPSVDPDHAAALAVAEDHAGTIPATAWS
jgi:hypothetical protein